MPNAFVRAPSEPDRIYVTGSKRGGSAAVLWATVDGGAHWNETSLPGEGRAEVLAVDPTNAGRVFVLRASPEPDALPDRIDVSEDAGATYHSLIDVDNFGGLSLTPDGATLFVGSRNGGLQRLDDGAAPLLLQPTLHVGCVHYRDDTLWLCARDQPGFDSFAIATSRDRGETVTPYLHSGQLRRLRTCGNPQQAATCNAEWNQWKNDVFGSTLDPPLPVMDAAVVAIDGALDDATAQSEQSVQSQPAPTGCRAVHAGSGGAQLGCWLWCLLALRTTAVARRRSITYSKSAKQATV
jgi:hypothetical protein